MTSPTPNKNYTYPAHGGAVNAWDSPLNANFDQIDLNVGGTYPITLGSSFGAATYNSSGATIPSTAGVITLPSSLAQNMNYQVGGTIAANTNLIFPSAGAFYFVTNNSSGAFTLTAKTGAGTGVTINQGGANSITCDGVNISYGNSNQGKAQLGSYLGNPNTNVAGVVAATNGAVTDATWDVTDQQLYVATTQGTAATTVWTPMLSRLVPEGYLTVSTDTNNPILTADAVGTTLSYVPYLGNWTVLSNGTVLYPYQFSVMQLFLTNSQAASQIYDVFMWWNNGTPVIGVGVAWSVATAGSCSRGTGAGTTELARFGGIWTNAVAMNFTYNPTGAGNTTTNVGANQLIYLGSVFINSVAGQITCSCNYGQSRKWGVWNAYNRVPIILQIGDSTAAWTYVGTTVRPSNNNTANSGTIFSGLPEERLTARFRQSISGNTNFFQSQIGIGYNSVSTFSAKGEMYMPNGVTSGLQTCTTEYINVPFLGQNVVTCLENYPVASGVGNFSGGSTVMLMSLSWRA